MKDQKKMLALVKQAKDLLVKALDHSDADEGDEGASVETETPTLPDTADEIAELSAEDVDALIGRFNLDGEGLKTSAKRALLVTARAVLDEDDDIDVGELKALAASAGIKTKQTPEALTEELQGYLAEAEPTTEEGTEETAADEEAPADEDEAPKKKKKASDDDEEPTEEPTEEATEEPSAETPAEDPGSEDGVDRESIAAKYKKLPPPEVMKKRLKAYNAAAPEGEEIDMKKLEPAYRELVARMIDGEGKVVDWGTAYIMNGACYCCGLELETVKTKKGESPRGKCTVTEKVFELTDENTLVEVEDE